MGMENTANIEYTKEKKSRLSRDLNPVIYTFHSTAPTIEILELLGIGADEQHNYSYTCSTCIAIIV